MQPVRRYHHFACVRAPFAPALAPVIGFAFMAGIVAACGGGGDGGTQPIVIPKGFSVSLSSSALSVTAGSNTTLTATIGRTGSFAGTINLSAEGLPTGVTATFAPSSITATTTSTTLTVVAVASTIPGSYSFTIRGTASGLADQTVSATLTVAAQPAFDLTVAAPSLTVQAGFAGKTIAQVARTNFAESVSLTVEGAPTGVAATFLTPSLAGDTTSLTVTVATNTTPGSYPLLVRAHSSLSDRTVTLTLVVTPPLDFVLSLLPTTLSVQQGQTSAPTTVSIARSGGLTAAVAFTVTGLPAGVTANLGSSSVTGASTTLTLSATLAATTGTANIVIHGTAAGVAERTVTLALTVTLFPGSFTLTLNPSVLPVAQASSEVVTVTVARTAPFSGPVALSVTGSPAGTTSSLGTATIAAGATSTTLTVTASILAAPTSAQVNVHATGAGVPDQDAPLALTVTASPASLTAQHMIVQEGLAIAFASTVLQTQVQVLLAVGSTGTGSATFCTTLTGGGSVQSLPVGADGPRKLGVYYDNGCVKPFMIGDVSAIVQRPDGQIDITENATYFSLTGVTLGVLSIQESAQISSSVQNFLSGLGTFVPANGATTVKLGLTCILPSNNLNTLPCQGGIQQNVPSLGRAIGSVTPLTLHVTDQTSPVTFDGNSSVLTTGALNALTLSLTTPTVLNVAGGTTWGTSSQQGGAGTFSLFPPTPTGWTVTDAAHDMKFAIDVVSNTVRNSVGTVKQISTGLVIANIAVDQSGTGTVTWSDGSTATITSWLFAN